MIVNKSIDYNNYESTQNDELFSSTDNDNLNNKVIEDTSNIHLQDDNKQ